jgi:tRNA threonylcarbamoyladenosine biosynthesis protein TsaB
MSTKESAVLAIDTSGSFCSVAFRNSDGRTEMRTSEGEGDHFERLPVLVSELCAEVGVLPSRLTEIRIGLGPGSFTGLRIGLGFAKGLACANGIELRGQSSFVACAKATIIQLESSRRQDSIAVFSDARRGEVYWGVYKGTESGSLDEIISPTIVTVAEVVAWQNSNPTSVFTTPLRGFAVSGISDVIVQDHIGIGLIEDTLDECEGRTLETLAAIEPHYIRAVAAKTIQERRRD